MSRQAWRRLAAGCIVSSATATAFAQQVPPTPEAPRTDDTPAADTPARKPSPIPARVPDTGTIVEVDGARAARPPRLGTKSIRIEIGDPQVMTVGEVVTLPVVGVARLALGNGRLVKATVVDERQIVLLAESAGDTTLHVWLRGGRQVSYSLRVVAQRHDALVADLVDFVKDTPTLNVRTVGERIVIEGKYPDTASATRIKTLAASFPQVLNLAAEKPMDADPLQLERMVQLDLRVIEVKKSALDQLGIKWATTANGPLFATNALGYANTPWRPGSLGGFPPVTTGRPVTSYLGFATQLTSALSLLEERGDAWTLAEPRLTCKSGGESKFIAGGEIPIPVAQGNGAVGIEYKKYGVLLEFKPMADGEGNIDSGILIEVSEPDTRNSNAGFVAFTTNRTETQMTIKQGEPLVISGLLRQRVERSSDGLPGLARIPILSYLFGAREARTEQTELLVVVMPRVISPDSEVARQSLDRSQELTEDALRETGESLHRAPSRSPLNPADSPGALPAETPQPPPFTIQSR